MEIELTEEFINKVEDLAQKHLQAAEDEFRKLNYTNEDTEGLFFAAMFKMLAFFSMANLIAKGHGVEGAHRVTSLTMESADSEAWRTVKRGMERLSKESEEK